MLRSRPKARWSTWPQWTWTNNRGSNLQSWLDEIHFIPDAIHGENNKTCREVFFLVALMCHSTYSTNQHTLHNLNSSSGIYPQNTATVFGVCQEASRKGWWKHGEGGKYAKEQPGSVGVFAGSILRANCEFAFAPWEITCRWSVSILLTRIYSLWIWTHVWKWKCHTEKHRGFWVRTGPADRVGISKQTKTLWEVCVREDVAKRQLGGQRVGNSIWS